MNRLVVLATVLASASLVCAGYVNFETAHVHPIDLSPSGDRLLVVNTPDALLEVFGIQPDGNLVLEKAIPVGLEPVTVRARTDGEAWVVNNLSDSVSIVDLEQGLVVETLAVGDEPTDVVFTANRAFVAVSSEDRVKVYSLPSRSFHASVGPLYSRDLRALAVSPDGGKVYAVSLRSGNQTTVVNANVVHGLSLKPPGAPPGEELHEGVYQQLNLGRPGCLGADPPSPPPLPPGIERNPDLTSPEDGIPKNSIIVRWDEDASAWLDNAGGDWTHCVRFRLPDRDLFIIDPNLLNVTPVPHLGTNLFDVSVHPTNGKVYVPHTDSRNFVRFEHPQGLRGHFVDNRLAIVDPSNGNATDIVELNSHIDRQSDPETNLEERLASISQPGAMSWKSDGSVAYLAAIGSDKVFRVDGNCRDGACIFGPQRADPISADVGLGPTGVVLRESTESTDERLYVINRVSHSVTIVDTSSMQAINEIPLHDPSSTATRVGRRFLYESVQASAHGDASCASCHPFGDMDGLAWELGNPEGDIVLYEEPLDNVAFAPVAGETPPHDPDEVCQNPLVCANHVGFDPQKGPMVTQTLRGMLEPLHSRGDRPTFRDFNQTFVNLMGAANVAPTGQTPAGLPDELMEQFRQFALQIRFPPNPHRNVDDSLPCGLRSVDPTCEVQVYGATLPGNPTEGEHLFHNTLIVLGYTNCAGCHQTPFGTFRGKLGGVEPTEPTSADATRLHAGAFITEFPIRHFDIEIPHMRNLYEKFGPNPSQTMNMTNAQAGFGYTHDGSIPDLARLMTTRLFGVHPDNGWQDLRDVTAFMFAFPTGTKPSVGRQVTLPAGTPPTGSAADESLLATLTTLGDLNAPDRHCELIATTVADGRPRTYRLASGTWWTDAADDAPVAMPSLRENATGPITFTCGTLGSGVRLGGDRDEDGVLNGDDCAPADAGAHAVPPTIVSLTVEHGVSTRLQWESLAPAAGESVRYEVLGATLLDLAQTGIGATACVAQDLESPSHDDLRPDPPDGEGYYYLVRGVNPCGLGDLGSGREPLANLDCP